MRMSYYSKGLNRLLVQRRGTGVQANQVANATVGENGVQENIRPLKESKFFVVLLFYLSDY
jgi:hypothetical protein